MQAFNGAQQTKQLGVTLVEVMLVLAVGAMIWVISVQQYNMFKSDKDIRQIQYNVDMLAQAAADYYWANCNGTFNPGINTITPGTLNPNNPTPPGNPYPLIIASDLTNKGYLPASLSLAANSIASNYAVQMDNKMYAKTQVSCDDAACSSSSPKTIGTIVSWTIQVSVKLRDTSKAQTYKNLLQADCLSEISGGTVLPCTSAPANSKTYAVFLRSPAFPTPLSKSALNQNRAKLSVFNQQYTVKAITNLTTGNHPANYQYYLCTGY